MIEFIFDVSFVNSFGQPMRAAVTAYTEEELRTLVGNGTKVVINGAREAEEDERDTWLNLDASGNHPWLAGRPIPAIGGVAPAL